MHLRSKSPLATGVVAMLLSAALASCATPVASPTAPTIASTAAPSIAPTTAPTIAPTTAPTTAPTIAPTTAPVAGKLPALSDTAWLELGRGDFLGDGTAQRVLYLASQDVEPRQGFIDEYLAARAMLADTVVLANPDDTIVLQLDRTGVSAGGAELRSFAAEAAPEAFVIALDPASPYLLTVLPLDGAGLQTDTLFVIEVRDNAYGIVELSEASLVTGGTDEGAAAELLSPEEQQEIGLWALQHLDDVAPGTPAVVGALARAGDYAVARATLYGEERPRALFLRHDADGWNVLLDTTQPNASALERAGVPLSLGAADPRLDVLAAAGAHLQDPRGNGMAGSLVLEAFADSFARLVFLPTRRDLYDPPTMFFAATQSGWSFVTAGTAFRPEDYDALGIPASVR